MGDPGRDPALDPALEPALVASQPSLVQYRTLRSTRVDSYRWKGETAPSRPLEAGSSIADVSSA
eukprot:777213-Rhodomonas_salina.10